MKVVTARLVELVQGAVMAGAIDQSFLSQIIDELEKSPLVRTDETGREL